MPDVENMSSPSLPTAEEQLKGWLNKNMRIKMTDGRMLIGMFVCTDKDSNIILASCQEYLKVPEGDEKQEPRFLGLAMIPGPHITTIEIEKEKPAAMVNYLSDLEALGYNSTNAPKLVDT